MKNPIKIVFFVQVVSLAYCFTFPTNEVDALTLKVLKKAIIHGKHEDLEINRGQIAHCINNPIDGETLVHVAAKNQNVYAIRFLKENQANLDSFDHVGLTPLMRAATAGNEEMTQALLNNGAKWDTKNLLQQTASNMVTHQITENDRQWRNLRKNCYTRFCNWRKIANITHNTGKLIEIGKLLARYER